MKLLIDGSVHVINEPMTLEEINSDLNIVAAVVDGKLREKNYLVTKDCAIKWVTLESSDGKQIYERSLILLFLYTCHKLYPHAHIKIEHALQDGLYCTIDKEACLKPSEVKKIKEQMQVYVKDDIKIIRQKFNQKQAIQHFISNGLVNKAKLLKVRNKEEYSVYKLDDYEDYFFGLMVPSTKYLKEISLEYFSFGLRLARKDVTINQYKLFNCMQEYERWGELIHVSSIANVNEVVQSNRLKELMLMSEAMIDKKLSELASIIEKDKKNIRMILIAGPSSAGKTTFSYRLAIHLKILGIEPVNLSMDDFYLNREDTPKLPDGSYDFESIEAVDLELFNETILKLINQEEVYLPRFNFKTGLRYYDQKPTTLRKNQVLIIEGIHGLNPKTSSYIPKYAKFKIYINALTHLNYDEHHRISTSDYRLIRRIVRDHQFRNWSATQTILHWPKVKYGEDHYIYPYQEEADYIFNTSMVYELPVLKPIAKSLLDEVSMDSAAYLEANRLNKLLDYIEGANISIPQDSLLTEFVGNSIFTNE